MGDFVHGICSPGSGVKPFDRIMLESPMGSRFFGAHDDAGSLLIGWIVYRSAGTQANDMTKSAANFGSIFDNGKLYVVEVPGSDSHQTENFGGDLSTAYSANDPILVREIRIGDRLWLKGSSLTVAEDEIVVVEANGLVSNVGDSDGATIEITGHAFLSLGSLSSGTWMVGEYLGIIAYDDSA